MPEMEWVIEPARAKDLSLVIEILEEAAEWMMSKGIEQWDYPVPAEVRSRFQAAIGQGLVYIVRSRDGEPLATFRVQWGDKDAWLYTLAVRPAYMGHGLGAHIIDWVAELFRGRIFRLDCIAANDRLRKWYEGMGFRYLGTVQEGAYELAQYERAPRIG